MIIDLILNRIDSDAYSPREFYNIDLILDRIDSDAYSPREFYKEVQEYGGVFGSIAWDIARAMDVGAEEDVKRELCRYVLEQGYNPQICEYINSVNWL